MESNLRGEGTRSWRRGVGKAYIVGENVPYGLVKVIIYSSLGMRGAFRLLSF